MAATSHVVLINCFVSTCTCDCNSWRFCCVRIGIISHLYTCKNSQIKVSWSNQSIILKLTGIAVTKNMTLYTSVHDWELIFYWLVTSLIRDLDVSWAVLGYTAYTCTVCVQIRTNKNGILISRTLDFFQVPDNWTKRSFLLLSRTL